MILPWNTDAPIYHFPYATIGLIVVNTLAFGAELASEDPEPWMLTFGEGLHPLQWITSVFMHADPMHLIGNMIFLWAFGLVIEGKLGWWRFLLVYLGLGAFESAVVQLAMQNNVGSALGASGAIYGLLAMSIIWAPKNNMSCFLLLGLRPITFQAPILMFCGIYVMIEIYSAYAENFEISSSMLHLAGALPGFVLAAIMLKLSLVDCENLDLWAVMTGREGEEAGEKKADVKALAEREKSRESKRAMAQARLQNLLQQGEAQEALQLHNTMAGQDATWRLSDAQLLELIKALHKKSLWSASIGVMVEYLKQCGQPAPRMRLALAQILIVHKNRPGRALDVLAKVDPQGLSPELAKTHRQLVARARKLAEEGELEMETDDW